MALPELCVFEQIFFYSVKHVEFHAKKEYLHRILQPYFIFKKFAAEAHRILLETYDDHALSETTYRYLFRRSQNN